MFTVQFFYWRSALVWFVLWDERRKWILDENLSLRFSSYYLPLLFPEYFSSLGNHNLACYGAELVASRTAVSRGTPKCSNEIFQEVNWGTLLYLKCAIVLIALLAKHLGSIWEPGHSWELKCRTTAVGRLMPKHLWAATPALVAPAPATS